MRRFYDNSLAMHVQPDQCTMAQIHTQVTSGCGTCSTSAGVIGPIYVLSAVPGSVMIVAGLEFRRITVYPSAFSALHA